MDLQNPGMATLTLPHRGQVIRGNEYRPENSDRTAPSVLIVHGFSDSSIGPQRLFVQIARRLVEAGAVVRAYDRLGQGISDGEFEDITLRDEVEQVSTMIREFAADRSAPVHVLAHSLGAVEAAMAVTLLSDRVASLTLWSPAGVVVDDITVKHEIQGQPIDSVAQNGGFDFGGMWLGPAFFDDIRNGLDIYEAAAGYNGPVDIVHGTADQIVPLEYGRRYAELLPHATFTAVTGADHTWSSRAWRGELLTRLLTFLGLPGAG
ncbi:alpha/beta hydrolase [Rhodococcus cercidiphylli]|jgi:pimeloyl-ACP methyl ester carboxylesterase|uniref:Alpha/beta fold hydrolase n=1 Tax=Rhodococcus cercidiphylli TaxID=489916 RepID=A0ABU4AUU4_9NOCA|nr:alpha/beta fold hydrolase [Rhodococcus cercidiphylli]MDV6230015.1 alpha/beta fold hydrolase [Rhodococcus cercidiphylli]